MASIESVSEQIANQTALFNQLRLQNAEPSLIDEAKKKLGELKKSLALSKGSDGSTPKDGAKKRERLLLKTAKGTRDYGPAEMFCRESIERTVKECFTTYGGSCLDTPVFERKDILAGKYGEDAKLIFDLMDQGGEQLALRYDHTVPLARYLAMTGATNLQSKIWQVGKVYRRDNPVVSKGRMREFSQADFDICGTWDPMIPDGEIISLVCTILSKLDVGEFTIKINHRKILDGIFEVCGVPQDKNPTDIVRRRQIRQGGFLCTTPFWFSNPSSSCHAADKIGEYVKHKGGPSLLEQLTADEALMANANAKQGISDMGLLFTYLRVYGVIDKISFDLSLARGLDYYTGIIYEAVVEASAPPGFKASATAAAPTPASDAPKKTPKKPKVDGEEEEIDESQVGVGSIAAGGRYDNLVGMFTAAAAADGKKVVGLPCIGISIGLDRIFALVWPKWVAKGGRCKETMVYVMAAGDGLLEERIGLVRELRDAGIKASCSLRCFYSLNAQFAAAEQDEVPFAVIFGADELKSGNVNVKEQKWEIVGDKKVKIQAEEGNTGTVVRRDGLVEWIKNSSTYREWLMEN
ncbi:Histidine--tRNA ligase, mitochondrial [Mycena sanguinolenta]|uniref:histidine--tRNA ligase n=1 Tax=Mycena sanguinolenta TaxID=230812 RepID=A0A8H7CMN9_9AGAR|nr:Histidine--tRNA ligase, mitochondrial [Mycena sanguinolenta]